MISSSARSSPTSTCRWTWRRWREGCRRRWSTRRSCSSGDGGEVAGESGSVAGRDRPRRGAADLGTSGDEGRGEETAASGMERGTGERGRSQAGSRSVRGAGGEDTGSGGGGNVGREV